MTNPVLPRFTGLFTTGRASALTARRAVITDARAVAVYCRQNHRRLVQGRAYATTGGGLVTLDSITGVSRWNLPAWIAARGGKLAVFTYRPPRNGASIRFRQRLIGGAVVDLPWRIR